jgi:mycothiol S-conjugate amidase
MLDASLTSPFDEWITNWSDREDRWPKVTTRVHAADYFHVRDAALLAHATQIDPEGFWFAVPLDLQRSIWPTEEFELAFTTLPTHADPARGIYEDDLFIGLRG